MPDFSANPICACKEVARRKTPGSKSERQGIEILNFFYTW